VGSEDQSMAPYMHAYGCTLNFYLFRDVREHFFPSVSAEILSFVELFVVLIFLPSDLLTWTNGMMWFQLGASKDTSTRPKVGIVESEDHSIVPLFLHAWLYVQFELSLVGSLFCVNAMLYVSRFSCFMQNFP
jgi:hypothetical protein